MTPPVPQDSRDKLSFTAVTTYIFERIMPHAFVLAIALTALVALAAALLLLI